ncbi:hypothetical protein RSAG8_11809, partial [Rhizoctonia solani AG-8 WAC10335]
MTRKYNNQHPKSKIPQVSPHSRHTIDCGPGSKPLKVEHRVGGWLPRDHRIIERYISKLLEKVKQDKRSVNELSPSIVQFKNLIDNNPILLKVKQDKRSVNELSPSIVQFKNLIDNNPILRMGFTEMFDQIRDYDTMFKAFDYIITHAIPYEDNELVGFPINAILDWPMGTDAGLATFLSPEVNAQFKSMFDEWSKFLSSPESRTHLTTEANGWFGPAASAHMPNFAETYKCDYSAQYYGFRSWDDFFTREFLPDVRPVKFTDPEYSNIITSACESCVYKTAYGVQERDKFWHAPHHRGERLYYGFRSWDDFFTREFLPDVRPVKFTDPEYSNIITSACESCVYKTAYGVQERDKFWVKGEPYSLRDMLNNDSYTDHPVTGTIDRVENIPGTYYAESPVMGFDNPDGPDPAAPNWSQAYISAIAARALIWIKADNTEIGLIGFLAIGMGLTGTIDRVENIPGTYYAESPVMGFDNPNGPDPAAPNWSQAYISAIAARALIWIKADNPEIGLIGFLAIGMSEVSTCEVTVKKDDKVSKGDQLGMFHFGGSTHCLIFRNGVKVTFDVAVGDDVLLNKGIATVGEGGPRLQ